MLRNTKKDVNLNNKGFTLIELLVVLAIVAIITTMAGLTIATVNNANVSKAAANFEALINRSRSQSIAMGPDAGRLVITCENGKVYGTIGTGDKELICNKQIKVYFGDISVGGGNPYDVTAPYLTTPMADGDSYIVEFTSSGSVRKNDAGGNLCKLLFVRNKKQVEVVLYRQTGKHVARAF